MLHQLRGAITHRAFSSYQAVAQIKKLVDFEEGFGVYTTLKQNEKPNHIIYNELFALAKRANSQHYILRLVDDVIKYGPDTQTLVNICYVAINNSDLAATVKLIMMAMRTRRAC